MLFTVRRVTSILFALLAAPAICGAEGPKPYTGACTAPVDSYFANEVWLKVGQTCLECHREGADAEESDFVLLDPKRSQKPDDALRHNRTQFADMAKLKNSGGESRLLLKPIGKLRHGGKEVIKPESPAYAVLADFVKRVNDPSAKTIAQAPVDDPNVPPFFAGVVMLDDRALLRRATLSLAGRLPSDAELAAIKKDGRKALPAVLDAVMKEDAFYARIREGFNDIFLTEGIDENADAAVLSYDHFSKTRLWYQKHDLSHITDPKARQQAGYKLADDYRKALLLEPMKLVEHIVRNDKPFTEIVTADYIMVSPYSARGYGIYDQLKDQFKNPDDPFEFVPVRLKALVGRNRSEDQDSKSGFYPHAGLLSTFQYMRRYPTTETNRNRLRARMYYQHFLGVDVLELAARVSDAAAVTAKFENPTMQAAECVVCHRTLDPAAGLFQDYWKFEGVYGKRKGGWFTDMFGPGYEGEDMPADERWRALQWLGERTAKDPRFAVAMVEHVHYILTGRRPLLPPKELDDPLFAAKRRAYQTQRKEIEAIATRFAENNFNLKDVFKDLVQSEFYRADGLATALADPKRRAELDSIGLVRMLAPEQIERKVNAVFGRPWGKLDRQLAMLYGGIDSQEVTERAADPSGAMGAIQRILANEVACRETAAEFSRPASDRRLFPNIETDVIPRSSPEADAKIRAAIAHLHRHVLGRDDAPGSPEVTRTFELFADIVTDAAKRKGERYEIYACRPTKGEKLVPDPNYTIRGWRAVMTYLLRRPEFLYE